MRNIAGVRPGHDVPDHLGLAYDVWVPELGADGKSEPALVDRWLSRMEAWSAPADYVHSYARWLDALRASGARAVVCKLASRALVGHGNPSGSEVGLTVHRTWGVPMLPGSSLKGLLNHYVDAVYGPEDGRSNPERLAYAGVLWKESRIVRGPGAVHRALFGAPDSDEAGAERPVASAKAERGLVEFCDALFVPPSLEEGTATHPFAHDVLTPHQKDYYRTGKSLPNDYDEPTPVPFLSIRPGTAFLIALSGPPDWTALALRLLRDALREWGIGGKTSAGYGRIGDGWRVVVDPERERLVSNTVLADFRAQLADESPVDDSGEKLTQRQRLNRLLQAGWPERLMELDEAERQEAARLLEKVLKSASVREDSAALAERIRKGGT